eukprot:15322197-Ditylum_brightwellii.AAC.1
MAAIILDEDQSLTVPCSQLVLPSWIGDFKKITFKVDGHHHIECFSLDNEWYSNFTPAAALTHASTSGLTCNCPGSLPKDLAPIFTDRAV